MTIQIDTPLGPIRSRVTIDPGPMRLAELVPSAVEITDILVARAVDLHTREGNPPSCRPRCGACCRQMVPLSPPEVFLFMDLIDACHTELGGDIDRRFQEAADTAETHHLISMLLEDAYDDDCMMAAAEKYFHLQIPCPFLENESCRIYPYRPIACRLYTVTTPPEFCRDPFSGRVSRIPTPMPLSLTLAQLTARLTGMELRLVPLSLAPIWAHDHRHIHDKTWPGVELFREFLRQLNPPAPTHG